MPSASSRLATLATLALVALPLRAQGGHVHTPGMTHPGSAPAASTAPVQGGQSAFAALQEVVALLDADPSTDWATVDLERLRQHLIDMDEVVLRSTARATPVPGGARFVVRGATPRTVAAIRRMATAHSAMLATESPMRAVARTVAEGAEVTVTAARVGDAATERRIRALGFVGVLTAGGHHGAHHLMIARGAMGGHAH
jgi:hypothetical protein